jgi:hypothetical protein
MTQILDIETLRWLLAFAPMRESQPESVAVNGDGPIGSSDFESLLEGRGVEVCEPLGDLETLVLGRDGWSRPILEHLIQRRAGSQLRVYSQEMFLLYLVTGEDPLNDAKRAIELKGDHPALCYLSVGIAFRWPSTNVSGPGPGPFDPALLEKGFLGHLGYAVGVNGRPEHERREALRTAYLRNLPPAFPGWYVTEWGAPSSGERLRKIADSIATFCRNAKKRRVPPEHAIHDWERDLGWLRAQFYDGRYRFQWPSTEVFDL